MSEERIYSYFQDVMKQKYPQPRASFYALMNLKPKQDLIGAEIGVFEGINAKAMLNNCSSLKLYLIDGYERVVVETGGAFVPEYQRQEIMRNADKNLASFNGRAIRILKQSEVAYKDFSDECFDYVYIDGEHLYDWVKRDIELWYPKVKKGGVFAGHDFEMAEVMRAVAEFRYYHKNLNFFFSTGNGESDWWVIKYA